MTTDLCTFAIRIHVNHDRAFVAYVAFKADGLEHDWESAPHEDRESAALEAGDFIRRRLLSHQYAFQVIQFEGSAGQ